MQVVGCPEPASVVDRMEMRRSFCARAWSVAVSMVMRAM
jgi:hypothetical protein